ncbi:unnamed protein product [Sphagnum jensenii]|uniref:GTP cyclohydrolase 1 n=1 Tax=Sphagnum jensenii TaxID=128206 RepID=A0ABP1A5X5_9BRYO
MGHDQAGEMSTIAALDVDPSKLSEMMVAVKVLLRGLGEDVTRDGLLRTPLRVAQAFQSAIKGYQQSAKEIVGGALFAEVGAGGGKGSGGGCGGMVVVRNIEVYALCEGCLLPFRLRCHVAYIPSGERVVGLSKLARVAEMYAKRLQTPLQFVEELAQAFADALKPEPLGVAVLAESWHLQWPGVIEDDVAVNPKEMVGWTPLTVCAGRGQFEDKGGDIFWSELMGILQLEGTNMTKPCAVEVDSQCAEYNISGVDDTAAAAAAVPEMIEAVKDLLRLVGEDPCRTQLHLTPWRFVRWLWTSTRGSRVSVPGLEFELDTKLNGSSWGKAHGGISGLTQLGVILESGEGAAAEVIVGELDLSFCSQCEHHLLPFLGVVHVGYVIGRGGGRLDRLSMQRMVRSYSCRLQVQERLTRQIAEAVGGSVMVVVEANHMCMLSRGVKQHASSTVTYASLGIFASDASARTTFLQLVGKRTSG